MLTISDIKSTAESVAKGTDIVQLILFGSYAKGTATSNSDIDLFMMSNGKITGLAFFDIKSKLEDAFCTEIDLIPDLDVLPNSPIERQIQKTGVVIYEQ